MLKKELTLYERDEDGKLIPQEATLSLSEQDKKDYPELVGEKIAVIPMTRGELKKMFGLTGKDSDKKPDLDKDTDAELVVSNCITPSYTMDELVHAKPIVVRSIVRTIFVESGVKMDDVAGTSNINDKDEFAKN